MVRFACIVLIVVIPVAVNNGQQLPVTASHAVPSVDDIRMPTDVNAAYGKSILAAAHRFTDDGNEEFLIPILIKCPQFINQRKTFDQPRKPSYDDTFTLLHRAAKHNRNRIANFLIKNGADVNAKTDDGSTPLHFAAQGGYFQMARVLVENGADPEARTDGVKAGIALPGQMANSKVASVTTYIPPKTALDLARERQSSEIEVLLREAMKK